MPAARASTSARGGSPGAMRWIARGHYVAHRVFFADEPTAVVAGYRPCARCLPDAYREWKAAS